MLELEIQEQREQLVDRTEHHCVCREQRAGYNNKRSCAIVRRWPAQRRQGRDTDLVA
jgi:hypothetical protein